MQYQTVKYNTEIINQMNWYLFVRFNRELYLYITIQHNSLSDQLRFKF